MQQDDRKKGRDQWLEAFCRRPRRTGEEVGTSGWSFGDRGAGLEMHSGGRG